MINPQRFAASLSASHAHSRLPSTHIPTVASMLNSQSCGNKAPSHRNPWFTWLSPPSTALYCTMNAVTSRQCQGERNVSEASPVSLPSLRLSPVNDPSVESIASARPGQMSPWRAGWRERRIQTVITGNHQLSQWISATPDWTAWPQTCDLSLSKNRMRREIKIYNKEYTHVKDSGDLQYGKMHQNQLLQLGESCWHFREDISVHLFKKKRKKKERLLVYRRLTWIS